MTQSESLSPALRAVSDAVLAVAAEDSVWKVLQRVGWTSVVVTPERGVRAVDGLLSGWHEFGDSHRILA